MQLEVRYLLGLQLRWNLRFGMSFLLEPNRLQQHLTEPDRAVTFAPAFSASKTALKACSTAVLAACSFDAVWSVWAKTNCSLKRPEPNAKKTSKVTAKNLKQLFICCYLQIKRYSTVAGIIRSFQKTLDSTAHAP